MVARLLQLKKCSEDSEDDDQSTDATDQEVSAVFSGSENSLESLDDCKLEGGFGHS